MKKTIRVATIIADTPTVNGNVYPRELLQTAIKQYVSELGDRKKFLQLTATGKDMDFRFLLGVVTNMAMNDKGVMFIEAEPLSHKVALFEMVEVVDLVCVAERDDDNVITTCKILYPYQTDAENVPRTDDDIFAQMKYEFDHKDDENETK